jgi:O-antigen/teichoic acid export membrane protein
VRSGIDAAVGDVAAGGARRLLWGSGATISLIAMAQGCNALSFAILTHRSTVGAFGAFVGVHAAATSLGALTDFGASQHRIRQIAGAGGQVDLVPWLLTRAVWSGLAAAALAAVALPLTGSLLSPATVLLLCTQVLTLNLALGANAEVSAVRSPVWAEGFVFAGNALIVTSALTAPDARVLEFTAAAAATSWLLTAALALAIVPSSSRRVAWPSLANPWRGSFHFGVGSLAVALGGLTVPLVALAAGADEAGQLGAVNRWAQPIALLAAGSSAYLAPRLASAASTSEAVRMVRAIRVHLIIGAAVALGLFLCAPLLVHVLLDDAYDKSVMLLRLYALSAVPVLIGMPMITLLNARGSDRFAGRSLLVANLGVLIAAATLAATIGAAAAPISAIVTSSALALVVLLRARQLVAREALETHLAPSPSSIR